MASDEAMGIRPKTRRGRPSNDGRRGQTTVGSGPEPSQFVANPSGTVFYEGDNLLNPPHNSQFSPSSAIPAVELAPETTPDAARGPSAEAVSAPRAPRPPTAPSGDRRHSARDPGAAPVAADVPTSLGDFFPIPDDHPTARPSFVLMTASVLTRGPCNTSPIFLATGRPDVCEWLSSSVSVPVIDNTTVVPCSVISCGPARFNPSRSVPWADLSRARVL
eukprot:TRINITY_DN2413_c0_g1_i7.p2 TRINITY_DN2413_c0_g1~~TRINITY_DN2413_c0_g1_i7.p2  ORF type:complete len:219 (-),score=4.63 TRINITY_DN2413_c0_g1_i7:934-1590(-)